ncbi:MAG: PorV/PorQ family protein [Ignavibacteria bacterium]|nr:PorV/PorQ family protein [Ignavibacteria bacterium]
MNKKYFNLIITLLLVSPLVFAGPRSKRGLSAAPELLIPVGSVGTALGGSNLANTSGLDALYWNPSGLANTIGTGEVMFSHQKYIADINLNYAAGSYSFPGVGVLALSIKTMDFGDIPVTTVDAPEGTGATYSPTYITAGISYARNMTDRIKFGATLKLISEKIALVSATGFAADFGLQYFVGNTGLKFGVVLKNIGPNMSFDGTGLEDFYPPSGTQGNVPSEPRRIVLGAFELPATLELGLSYDLKAGKNNMVTFSGAYMNSAFSADEYKIGFEYNYKKIFYLRGSYLATQDMFDSKFNKDDILFGPSFGAGVNYQFGKMNVGLDYAFRYTKRFSHNQLFTVKLGF